MHGNSGIHPVNHLHAMLRPGWINAAWIAGMTFLAGFGFEAGKALASWGVRFIFR